METFYYPKTILFYTLRLTYLVPARGWKLHDSPYSVYGKFHKSHLPIPRKGMETQNREESYLQSCPVSLTYSPQGDGNQIAC